MRLVIADTGPINYLVLIELNSFAGLKLTNFRYRQEIMDGLLDELAGNDA